MKLDFCVMCGTRDNLCFHHVVPKSKGGANEDRNILTVCGSCHAVIHQVACDWKHSKLTKDAIKNKKDKSERCGSIAYGYKLNEDGIHLDVDDYEMSIVDYILNLYRQGKSLRNIVRIINLRFTENKRKINSAQTISNIIKRYGIDYHNTI